MIKPGPIARRRVLKYLSGLTALAGSNFGGTLGALAAASSAGASNGDFKVIVCLYQYGGNDHANMIVPTDKRGYSHYADARGDIALQRAGLHAISLTGETGPVALHPALPKTAELINAGHASVIANVGPLEVPTTAKQYRLETVPLPLQLFSHSDQQRAWFTAQPATLADTGWLGRLADTIEPIFNQDADVTGLFSMNGPEMAVQAGSVNALSLDQHGKLKPFYASGALYRSRENAADLLSLMTMDSPHLLVKQAALTADAAMRNSAVFNEAQSSVNTALQPFPQTRLGRKMEGVARAILSAKALKQRRQVFFVGSSGWDFHINLLDRQNALLTEMDDALYAFTQAMRRAGLHDNVTTLTMGDFGRALVGNGRGSDHGWGGHHVVIGGRVNGGALIGVMPEIREGTPEDAGQGRLIPTVSQAQYLADVARWFGVSSTDLHAILPNLNSFPNSPLGLFQA